MSLTVPAQKRIKRLLDKFEHERFARRTMARRAEKAETALRELEERLAKREQELRDISKTLSDIINYPGPPPAGSDLAKQLAGAKAFIEAAKRAGSLGRP